MSTINFRKPLQRESLNRNLSVCVDTEKIPKGYHGVTSGSIPRGHLCHSEYLPLCKQIANRIERDGEESLPPGVDHKFRVHYEHFVNNVDCWETIPIAKCLTRTQILVGCLREGPAFAEWLKKARYYTFVDKVCEGAHYTPEEYILEGYKGYDSIFRESELIHWTEETSDVEYAFIPVGSFRDEAAFKAEFKALFESIKGKVKFPNEINTLEWIKSSKGYDPHTGKTIPTRDSMRNLRSVGPGWFGRRTIIRPFPGGIRDTVIPDPDTLAKIKLTGSIFKEICEYLPESGMSSKLSENFNRVLRRKLFHHLDFKKAGLTFPRKLFLLMGEVLEEAGIDCWFLKDIEDIYVEIDGDTFKTRRGFCLGWMNEALTVAIITLLRLMRKTYNLSFDFIVYNDDLVIGDQDKDVEVYSELFRFCAKEFFNSFQIFVSEKKIFSSRSVQFLEEYRKSELYGLDMRKRSIATAIYSKSLSSRYIWAAKMYAAVAFEEWDCEALLEKCMARGYEVDPSERERPYKAGGWYTPYKLGLDDSLLNKEWTKYILSLETVRMPKMSESIKDFDSKKAFDAKQRKIFYSSEIRPLGEEVLEFLEEQSKIDIKALYITRLDQYSGNKKVFRGVLEERVANLSSKFWDPP